MNQANNYWSTFTERRLTRRRTLAAGIGGAVALSLIAACGGSDNGSSSTPAPATDTSAYTLKPTGGVKGGKFSSPSLPANTWNPFSNYYNTGLLAGATVFDRLVSSDTTNQGYVLEAAASIETSDPLKVVIKLKPNMVYHDIAPVSGRPVKASDIVASQTYVKNLPNAYDKSFQVNYIDSISAPDDNTVVINLKKADGYLFGSQHLGGFGGAIVPEEMLANADTNKWIGSGPFQLNQDSSLDSRYGYKRFEKFRDAANVFMDEREMVVISDLAAQEAALRSDQIHNFGGGGLTTAAPFPVADRIASETAGKFTLSEAEGVGMDMIFPNMSKDFPWKNDIRVRQALYRATDGNEIIQLALGGKATILTGLLPKGMAEIYQLDPKTTEEYFKVDPKEAKQLLDAANYDYGREWEVIAFGNVTGGVNDQMAVVWQNQVGRIGMKTRVIGGLPTAAQLPEMAKGNFEIVVGSTPNSSDPSYSLRAYHSNSLTQYTNFGLFDPAIDAMIEKAEGTYDKNENADLVKDIQRELLKKYTTPIGFATPKYRLLFNSRLQNYDIRPVPIPKYSYATWWKA